MAQELVWARVGDNCAAVSRAQAEAKGYEVLADESVRDANGDVRRPTRANGRPVKPKTSVAKKAAAKKATAKKTAAKKTTAPPAAEVIAEPAPSDDNGDSNKEISR